ncbi:MULTISPECIES: hypothetical protein [unclassified Streptomyces]|uniref:hypothetical protein n=1 Tax=unclassified Streptomyces TaxID=2593676 RepID=UPI00118151C1|nr:MULTISPECIES: hypothetical protein [unclassified Streptomyces]TRO60634.1 hypothetical protein E4K73_30600 [Streptomyces sp. IB201691-2A2]
METFLTVVVILAMVALGAFLIHRLNNQHDERIAAFRFSRSLPAVRGPGPSAPPQVPGPAATSATGDRRAQGDGGRGRLRSWAWARTQGK